MRFGLIAQVLLSGPVDLNSPDGISAPPIYWQVLLYQRLPWGLAYGLLAGFLFIGLQHLWNTRGNRGKWWANLIVAVTIAKAVLFGIALQMSPTLEQALSRVVQNIESDAHKNHPDLPYTKANYAEAQTKADAFFKGNRSDYQKVQFAVDEFFGFYLINVRARSAYCDGLGVPIPHFVSAFIAANKDAYVVARPILIREGMTEDVFYNQIGPTLSDVLRKNIEDAARIDKTTTTRECEGIEANPDLIIPRLTFSKIQPAALKSLVDAL